MLINEVSKKNETDPKGKKEVIGQGWISHPETSN
jgi:hypothetical protein